MKQKKVLKHDSDGFPCEKCNEIINRFPGFSPILLEWLKSQTHVKNFHISDAGRGKADQTRYKLQGSSRAEYGESAHNYNMAVDIFFQINGKLVWDRGLYEQFKIPDHIAWYGVKTSPFYELPHFQIKNWRQDKDKKLVE